MSDDCNAVNALYRVGRNEYNLQHTWTWIHGRHQVDFGLDFTRDQSILDQDFNSDGTWTFNGRFSGNNLVDFLYGKASAFAQISPLYNNLIRNLYGAILIFRGFFWSDPLPTRVFCRNMA